MSLVRRLTARARGLKAETHALYLACRDPRTPWTARLIAALVVAYALSPLDLVPDFIPVLGYLDDLVLLPLGIALTIRLVPPEVLAEARAQAAANPIRLRRDWRAGAAILAIWTAALVASAIFVLRLLNVT